MYFNKIQHFIIFLVNLYEKKLMNQIHTKLELK